MAKTIANLCIRSQCYSALEPIPRRDKTPSAAFARIGGREVLTHAGKVSYKDAVKKAELVPEKYRRQQFAATLQVKRILKRR